MKHLVKIILLSFPGFESICRRITGNHVRGLMFHRFSPSGSEDPRFLSRDLLDEYIRYVTDRHDVWTPQRHLDYIKKLPEEVGGKCPVVFTVDDGYSDFYDVAYPIFKKYNIPAMLFVATGFVDKSTWFWWDRLSWLVEKVPAQKIQTKIGKSTVELDLETSEGRERTWHTVADLCRFISEDEKIKTINNLAELAGTVPPDHPPKKYSAVTWAQITEMKQEGVLFGAHTVRHPILSRVPIEVAEWEITESKDMLEGELGEPVEWFCFPQGGPADYTSEVREIVSKHFLGCYLAYQELESPDDPYTLPRYCVPHDIFSFRWIMCGAEFIVLSLKKMFGLGSGLGEEYWAGHNIE